MKKNIYTVVTLVLLLILSTTTSLAAQPSDSSTSTDTTEELKKRIEKAVEEKREQIKGALQGISADERGFIGEIQRVTDEAVTVKSKNTTTIIPITSSIQLLRRNSPIKIDDVAVGNWAIVIGKETSNGEFVPEKVQISTDSLEPRPQVVVMGSITTLTTREITVSSRLNSEEYTFTITKNSVSQNHDGTVIPLRQFQTDLQVLIVGIETETGIELKTVRALAPVEQ